MIRIALTGPESSGKSTLARAIASNLDAKYIPEFAREFLIERDGKYEQEDLNKIAKGHLNAILTDRSTLQVIDTDFVVLKIWSEEKFASCSEYIQELVSTKYFDLHLLCTPDIPWEEDPLRVNPDDRQRLFDLYTKELAHLKKPFIIVNGSLEERLEKSRSAILSISK